MFFLKLDTAFSNAKKKLIELLQLPQIFLEHFLGDHLTNAVQVHLPRLFPP